MCQEKTPPITHCNKSFVYDLLYEQWIFEKKNDTMKNIYRQKAPSIVLQTLTNTIFRSTFPSFLAQPLKVSLLEQE